MKNKKIFSNIEILIYFAVALILIFVFSLAFIFYQYKQIELDNNKVARDSLTEQAYIELETNK